MSKAIVQPPPTTTQQRQEQNFVMHMWQRLCAQPERCSITDLIKFIGIIVKQS